jgi:hypothetical protein
MIYQKLVDLIQNNSEMLANRFLEDVLSREETKSYKKLHEKEVYRRGYEVYSRLESWLKKDNQKNELQEHYKALGKKRCDEDIPLHEVIMALMLIKRHLWLYILETQFFNSSFEIYQALELNNHVILFFDRAIYFTTIGYEEALAAKK